MALSRGLAKQLAKEQDDIKRAEKIMNLKIIKPGDAGWEDILPILSRGEKARITLPSEYGYGDKGYPPIIPPKAVLTFEIELIGFSSVGNAERLNREKKALAAATTNEHK
eukprot:gene27627-34373_t